MPSAAEVLASQMGWVGLTNSLPHLPGTMEPGEMAHVQGIYAGVTFSTGVVLPDVGTYRPHLRIRRR